MAELSIFHFCGFEITQSDLVHKIGTDSLILGSLARHMDAQRILDIGTGTGVLALMLAKVYPSALITAIEPDHEAHALACTNFTRYALKYQIDCLRQDLSGFALAKPTERFDLIVCNPPYYPSGTASPYVHRVSSRQNRFLPPPDLFQYSATVLSEVGSVWIIVPFEHKAMYEQAACLKGLYFTEEWHIVTAEGKLPERIVIKFERHPHHFTRTVKMVGQIYQPNQAEGQKK
jgi:tRNA1Val (adenine37-N6)-methyltransferase